MKTPGEQITAALIERPAQRRFDITLERKTAGPITLSPGTSQTLERVIPGPTLPLRLRSLIPPGSTVGSSVLYLRETSITSSPVVPTAPAALKPQTNLTWESVLAPVVTIPGFMKASEQLWEDFAMFQSWIDSRLLYALSQGEEKQLLNGNGVSPNMQGLMLVALAVTTVPGTGGVALLDNVGAGLGALYGRGYIADGIVLNPVDWGKTLNTKAVAGGEYLLGDPGEMSGPPTLWGLPVILSAAMASGSYLVGQFNPYCQIFDRDDAAVEVSDENADDFIRNMVTVRAEERLAFAIYQPGAFAKGTFTP